MSMTSENEKKPVRSRKKATSATEAAGTVETLALDPEEPGAVDLVGVPEETLQTPEMVGEVPQAGEVPAEAPGETARDRRRAKPPRHSDPVIAEGFTGEKKTFGHDPYPELYAALRSGGVLQGPVLGVEPYGPGKEALVVGLGSMKGLIVEDDLGDHPKNLANMVGAKIAFKVKGIDRKAGVAYLSRKAALDSMANRTWRSLEADCAAVSAVQAKITAVMDELRKEDLSPEDRRAKLAEARRLQDEARRVGPARTCVVKWVLGHLAFVDIGGVTAFLPAKEMAHGYVADAREIVKPGDSFDVRVYRLDREAGKVFVTLKPFLPDPWATAAMKYRKGGLYMARVTRALDSGLILSLEQGVEMFSRHLPFGSPGPGSQVLVHVRDVDTARRRVVGYIARVLNKVG